MGKVVAIIIGIAIVFGCVKIGQRVNYVKMTILNAENAGYHEGYDRVYNEEYNLHVPEIKEKEKLYANGVAALEKKLNKEVAALDSQQKKEMSALDSAHEANLKKAGEDGLKKGKQDQLNKTNSEIEKKAKENASKGNWDDVLFEVKR